MVTRKILALAFPVRIGASLQTAQTRRKHKKAIAGRSVAKCIRPTHTPVAKQVAALDSKSNPARGPGSSPGGGTKSRAFLLKCNDFVRTCRPGGNCDYWDTNPAKAARKPEAGTPRFLR